MLYTLLIGFHARPNMLPLFLVIVMGTAGPQIQAPQDHKFNNLPLFPSDII